MFALYKQIHTKSSLRVTKDWRGLRRCDDTCSGEQGTPAGFTLQAHLSCHGSVLSRQRRLEGTRVHTRLNIKGHPSHPQRGVHTSRQPCASLPSMWVSTAEYIPWSKKGAEACLLAESPGGRHRVATTR